MKSKQSSSEKQRLRSQLDSIRGDYRKLQDKFASDSKHLKDFTSHEEKVVTYVNGLNRQKQALEDQISMAQKNEQLLISQFEEKYSNMDIIEQEKLKRALKVRSKYSRLIRKQKAALQNYELKTTQN